MNKQTIFGALELVSIPELGVKDVLAKIDTGAYTGALHCEKIKVIKNANGDKVLQFQPISRKHSKSTVADYQLVTVKSSTGHTEKRYVIPVTLKIQGKTYSSYIGLTTRNGLKRQILIGRRFLREHNVTVDVTIDLKDDKLENF